MARKSKGAFLLLAAALGGSPLFAQPDTGSRELIKSFNRKAVYRSAVFPGWGQWYKGYPARGAALAGMESLMLAGAYYSNQKANTLEERYRRGEAAYSNYTRQVDLTNYLLLAAGVTWGYGVLDAWLGEPNFSRIQATVGPQEIRVAYRVRF